MSDATSTGARGWLSVIFNILTCLVILGATAAGVWWINRTEPKAEQINHRRKSAALVETITVERKDWSPRLVVLGTVRPAQDIVLSPRVRGQVLSLSPSFVPGGMIQKGELLLQIDPADFDKQYGIEILRLWTASADYTEDLRISDEIIKGAVENYRRLRNTMRYLLGALHGFTAEEAVLPVEMPSLETWVLHRLAELDETVRKAYDEHDFKRVMTALLNFCSVDLSAVYFDIRKDSLYCDAPSDVRRRSARTVMAAILERLLAWLAPIMPFTTEETFLMSAFANRADSVHLLQFPETPLDWKDADLAARWEKIFRVRRVVTGAIEVERREKRIRSSLEAAPTVFISDAELLAAYENEVAEDIFITSQAELVSTEAPADAFRLPEEAGVAVLPGQASGVKCARSWKYFDPATADPEFPDVTPRDAAAIREIRG